jgi:hypothetical protein
MTPRIGDSEYRGIVADVLAERADAKQSELTVEAHSANGDDERQRRKSSRRVSLVRASDVEMEQVRFAIDSRVPLGALTLLVGAGGLGKSTLAISWVAQLTRGTLPGDLHGRAAEAVIASAEDSRAAVLKPRLVAAGADLACVHFVDVEVDGAEDALSLPADIDALEREMRRCQARLLVIDPLIAYLPLAINTDRDQHVRHALAPLAKLAERTDAAIVGIMHLNKRETSDIMMRVNGSGGFVNAARSVLLVGPDPDDADARVLAHGKSNVGEFASSQRFRIETRCVGVGGEIKTSAIVLLGAAEGVTASDLVRFGSDDERSAIDEAAAFLAENLPIGERVPVRRVKQLARDAGISERTLDRARRRARVRFDRDKFGGPYVWFRESCSPSEGHARHGCHAGEQGEQGDGVASNNDESGSR